LVENQTCFAKKGHFARLYVACLLRDGNLEFFKYENHPFPPALSSMGVLHRELLQCLEKDTVVEAREVDVKMLDCAAVNMLHPEKIC
jgi:hypothetical protein